MLALSISPFFVGCSSRAINGCMTARGTRGDSAPVSRFELVLTRFAAAIAAPSLAPVTIRVKRLLSHGLLRGSAAPWTLRQPVSRSEARLVAEARRFVRAAGRPAVPGVAVCGAPLRRAGRRPFVGHRARVRDRRRADDTGERGSGLGEILGRPVGLEARSQCLEVACEPRGATGSRQTSSNRGPTLGEQAQNTVDGGVQHHVRSEPDAQWHQHGVTPSSRGLATMPLNGA